LAPRDVVAASAVASSRCVVLTIEYDRSRRRFREPAADPSFNNALLMLAIAIDTPTTFILADDVLAARGNSLVSQRDGRGTAIVRRDDREDREHWRGKQRRESGCLARRMQSDSHHRPLVRGRMVFLEQNPLETCS
jgi:hypothetical protein